MVPMSALTASYTSSAVRWGVLETARSTARRCAVTLKPCCRRTSAGSAVISATFANLHPLVKSRAALPARPPQILVCVKISGDRSPEILTQTKGGEVGTVRGMAAAADPRPRDQDELDLTRVQ